MNNSIETDFDSLLAKIPTHEDLADLRVCEIWHYLRDPGEKGKFPQLYGVVKDNVFKGFAHFVALKGVKFVVDHEIKRMQNNAWNTHAILRGSVVEVEWYSVGEIRKHCSKETMQIILQQKFARTQGHAWTQVAYNPWKHKTFVTVEDESPVFEAKKVILTSVGHKLVVWALIPSK